MCPALASMQPLMLRGIEEIKCFMNLLLRDDDVFSTIPLRPFGHRLSFKKCLDECLGVSDAFLDENPTADGTEVFCRESILNDVDNGDDGEGFPRIATVQIKTKIATVQIKTNIATRKTVEVIFETQAII